ncbi:hypothetical protein [Phormidium nigroviride]
MTFLNFRKVGDRCQKAVTYSRRWLSAIAHPTFKYAWKVAITSYQLLVNS